MSEGKSVCCPGCRAEVVAVRPGWLAKASVPLAWGYCAGMVLGGGMTGPFLVMLTLFLMLAGASVIRTAHDLAFREPHCPGCGKILLDEPEGAATMERATAS